MKMSGRCRIRKPAKPVVPYRFTVPALCRDRWPTGSSARWNKFAPYWNGGLRTARMPPRFVIEMPEQTVGLAQMNGRVYHDRMTIRIDNTELVTGGSVGFDESLQLVFLLPIQEKWVPRNARSCKTGGTIAADSGLGHAVTTAGRCEHHRSARPTAAGSAIEKAIDDTVQKQLDRFLPRRN